MVDLRCKLSLERTALLKVASLLWNKEDVGALLSAFIYQSRNIWDSQIKRAIKERMTKKIMQLSLPQSLEDKLEEMLKPVCVEILKWRQYHKNYFPKKFVRESLDKLCWTQRETVDRKRTAEVLVKNENTSIAIRYKLACIYCLENDISDLWNKLPESLKKTPPLEENPTETKQGRSVAIWTCNINEELNKLVPGEEGIVHELAPYQHGFKMALLSANRVAAEYFFQKLTPKEKDRCLKRFVRLVVSKQCKPILFVPKEYYSDVLWFLLSQMTEEQQTEVFKTHPCQVLKCFLDWPLQGLFMRIANSVRSFLSEKQFYILLRAIAFKITDDSDDFNYRKLFGEFWQQSPDAFKRFIVNRSTLSCELLLYLFFVEDKTNISLMLRSANIQEKEEIIFGRNGGEIAKSLIYMNKCHLVKFFVQQCVSSQSGRDKFKAELKKLIFVEPKNTLPYEIRLWDKCLGLLGDLDQSNTKKRNINEDNRRSKRLCTEK